MLTLSQLSKSFGGRTLFTDVSLQINREDRIGLVGPNGAGKSTLFSLILGESSPDDGTVSLEKNVTMGFLPQEAAPAGDETILELACATSPEMSRVQKAIQRHEAAGTLEDPEYHEALDTFTELGGWQLEPRAKQILSGLAFRDSDFHRQAKALSGGWIMRAHLARLLVQEPDLLLLDEPTNHLDLESLVWFQEYLRTYPGAILMISHDREFLNELVGSIVEISQTKLHRYRGNYDKYIVEKAAREEQHLAAYKNQQKEIASLQQFADRFRAKASKASQAQSKLKQIDRMEKIEAPVSATRSIKFRFPQPIRSGLRVITLKEVGHTYKNTNGSGELTVYRGLNFEAERGQRTVLVGPNGAGKSTLLKLLGGALPIQQGDRLLGHNVRVGYFSQHRGDTLNMKHQVLESVLDSPNPVSEQTARTVLGSFLFRGDDVFKTVGVLSGGEKSRLALVKLLLDPPNLLLMDEPTTHLDIGSIDALIQALHQYEGTLLFISHDVHFIRAMATTVLHISTGQLTPYAGDYQYYLEKSKATSARAALTAGGQLTNSQPTNPNPPFAPVSPEKTPTARKTKEQKRAEAEARQAKSRLKKAHESKVAELEKKIHGLETRLAEITAELEKPETYQANGAAISLSRESATVSANLEQLMAEGLLLSAQANEN
jgi:ATP-binding cassette subfamily F protein 3